MKTTHAFAASAAALLLPFSAQAATFVTVGTYDENATQPNAVDTNASGNALASLALNDVAGFTLAVASAFAAGQGGVVNFNLPNGGNADANSDTTGILASYAGGTKTLTAATFTSNGDSLFNYTTFGTLTPISGTRGAIPTTSAVTAFRLALSGPEAVQTAGFTLLSRSIAGQNVLVEWLINGDLTTPGLSDTEAIANGNGSDDTFFSYTAPEGSAITGVRVTYQGTLADRRLGIDDFGFITVPEPGSALLALAGGVGLLLRRRR